MCVCCLQQNTMLIRLSNCTHSASVFEKLVCSQYTAYQLMVVCVICHEKLKNIAEFKKQAEQSLIMLNTLSKKQLKTVPKTQYLAISKITHTDCISEVTTSEIKPEISEETVCIIDIEADEKPEDLKYIDLPIITVDADQNLNMKDEENDFDAFDDVESKNIDVKFENVDDNFDWPLEDEDIKNTDTEENIKKLTSGEEFNVSRTGINKNSESNCGEMSDEDHKKMVNDLSNLFTKIWHSVKKANGDYYKMFETYYHLTIDRTSAFPKKKDRDIPNKKLVLKFLDLYQQVMDSNEVEIKYLNMEDLIKEMDENRKTINAEQYCQFCCQKYVHSDTKERHIARFHNESCLHECAICLYRFKMERGLVQHLFAAHFVRKKCRVCGLAMNKMGFLRKHHMWHKGNVTHQCQYCDKTFSSGHLRLMHVLNVHRCQMDSVQCALCGGTFNGAKGLKTHLIKYHPLAAQCKTCSVHFATADALNTHLQHGGCNQLHSACPVCGENFLTKELMEEHYDGHQVLQISQTLMREKRFKIYQNRKVSKQNQNHPSESQTKKKDIMCEICGKGNFKCNATLIHHQHLHTGEKPYQCKICQKTFRLGASYKLHMQIHTGERRYKCPVCDKAFRQQPHLRSHLVSHRGEKDHQCHLCEKWFSQRGNMLQHIRTVHEGLPIRRKSRRPNKP